MSKESVIKYYKEDVWFDVKTGVDFLVQSWLDALSRSKLESDYKIVFEEQAPPVTKVELIKRLAGENDER